MITAITAKKLASCMNSLQHGAQSKSLFLKDENPAEFFSLLENAFEQFQPAFDHDAALISRCIEDHWLLLRRERTVRDFEAGLYERLPDPTLWQPEDLHKMNLLDRYKTQAARSYQRSLRNVQTIQKISRDEQRWQHQLATEKQKFAIQLERWEKLRALADEPELPAETVSAQADGPQQTLYIGSVKGEAVLFETTPTNDQLRPRLRPTDVITRIYNFIGPVPAEFKHLDTPDAWREGASTSVQRRHTFAEWDQLTKSE